MSWLKEFFISSKTSTGILPIACPNCHQAIGLGDVVFSFGYFRHKTCHSKTLEVRQILGVSNGTSLKT